MVWRKFLFLSLIAICLTGCGGEEDAVTPLAVPQQKEATPQEVADKIIQEAQLNAPLPVAGSTLPPGMAQTFLKQFRQVKNQHSGSETGVQALVIVSKAIEGRIKDVERAQLWHYLLVYVDAHKILNPGSTKFSRQQERARIELKRPRVTPRGFIVDGISGQTVVMLDIHLPLEDKVYSEQLRVGEEIHGLKLVDIVGNNQGVTLEFLESGEIFNEFMKSAQ